MLIKSRLVCESTSQASIILYVHDQECTGAQTFRILQEKALEWKTPPKQVLGGQEYI